MLREIDNFMYMRSFACTQYPVELHEQNCDYTSMYMKFLFRDSRAIFYAS